MTGYDFHPEALRDLDEIWEYNAVDDRDTADRVIAEVLAAVRDLVSLPAMGKRRPDLASGPLRFHVVREYLIAYAPAEKPLWVVAVLHGWRNSRVMAAILRGRSQSRMGSGEG